MVGSIYGEEAERQYCKSGEKTDVKEDGRGQRRVDIEEREKDE